MTQAGEGPNCPYDTSTYPAWGAEVLAGAGGIWKPVQSKRTILRYELIGPCPRCGHADGISEFAPAVTFRIEQVGAPKTKKTKRVSCRCSATTHAGRKETERGCGQAADVEVKTK